MKIDGEQRYLWRAVDQDGEAIDLLVRHRRHGKAAERFFGPLLKTSREEPGNIVTEPRRCASGADARDDPRFLAIRQRPC